MMFIDAHFAVATQPIGMDGHGLDHGAPAAPPPTTAPSLFRTGRPWRSMAMSVVVPPMSDTITVSAPDRCRAPTRLAAGPERMVSTGQVKRHLLIDERTIALHHHQRRLDALFGEQRR